MFKHADISFFYISDFS